MNNRYFSVFSISIALFLSSLAPIPAQAAPFKNEAMRIEVKLPGTWKPVTAKTAEQRFAAAENGDDSAFYGELAKRVRAGNFFLFEEKPKSPVRADLQMNYLGKSLGGVLAEKDYRNLCYLWAKNHAPEERPFSDCQPRKLGKAWTAQLFYRGDPDGNHAEHQIKYFRADGMLILFTVAGTFEQAEAIFRNTRFY